MDIRKGMLACPEKNISIEQGGIIRCIFICR
jgi:hypothetical protein